MNFYSILIWEIIIVSALLIYFCARDLKKEDTFLNSHKKIAVILIILLAVAAIAAAHTRFIEPFRLVTKQITIDTPIAESVKIAFVSDIQVGNHKKTAWVQKITAAIEKTNPDMVLIGGDLIDNDGAFEDESVYLEPLQNLVKKYPVYYVLGNHEYGISSNVKNDPKHFYGDRSQLLIARMEKMGIKLLRNNLICPTIKTNTVCIFGLEEIWTKNYNFDELKNWPTGIPLIFLVHNPDGIRLWPQNYSKPLLTLSGHSHGGQIYLPGFGPLGDNEIELPKKYYSGLNDYQGTKIFTSVGAGESGGPIRFMVPPEITVINLKPQN